MKPLRYFNYDILFQEVPNEVSLVINISGCPYRCKGCHSDILQTEVGYFLLNDLNSLIEKYQENLTCVCFMGGDQNKEEFNQTLEIVKSKELKTCLYTGTNEIESLKGIDFDNLDYLKIGEYKKELGGLNSPLTNQIFYDIMHINTGTDKALNQFVNTTYRFQQKGI